MKRLSLSANLLILFGIALGLYALLTLTTPAPAESQTGDEALTGYAWSDTVGWLSLDGPSYGITIEADGNLSGYAWSDNIGWVSANTADVSGCPASPCQPTFDEGTLFGWLRALAPVGASVNEHGNWDGWISLNGPLYEISADEDGDFSGYAWGSDVVGWVDFSLAHTDYRACIPTYFCSDNEQWYRDSYCAETLNTVCNEPLVCNAGTCSEPIAPAAGAISVNPNIVRQGGTTVVTWSTERTDSCTVTGSNGDAWSGTSGSQTSSALNTRTTFTLSCDGSNGEPFTESTAVSITPSFREV